VLSRQLANAGHFPAIDGLASVSRCMSDLTDAAHRELASGVREMLAAYKEAADLVEVGAYAPGSNPRVDRALKCINAVNAWLKQSPDEASPLPQTLARLRQALTPTATSVKEPSRA